MKRTRDRAQRLERIARAQTAVALAERARHAAAEHERARCAETEQALIASLSGETPLHGLMVPAMARMLQANAREATALAAKAAAARQSECRERLRAERTAERAKEARRTHHQAREAQRLESLGAAAAMTRWIASNSFDDEPRSDKQKDS